MDEENTAIPMISSRTEETQLEQKERALVRWRHVQQSTTPIPRPRHGHRAVVMNDLIIVIGGGNEGMINETNVYNTEKNEWLVPNARGDTFLPSAAFGVFTMRGRIFTFGGMVEYGRYSNQLAELSSNRWEWKILTPKGDIPCARLGHTFVGCERTEKAYVFGGLANDLNDTKRNAPRYLNDLFMIDLSGKGGSLVWEKPETNGVRPTVRESHTAIVYETENVRRMVVYGGMNGVRLGDLWYLDLDTFIWSEIKFDDPRYGLPPLPRSLHTAVLIDDRMYVYGGWIPVSESSDDQHEKEWKCTNSLGCWNITEEKWEPLHLYSYEEESMPRARAGHCAAAVGNRMYIWSGRDGYRKAWSNQVCCRDMWILDTVKPEQPSRVSLNRAGFQSLDVLWPAVPGADSYFLQIGFGDLKESSVSPTKRQPSPRKFAIQKDSEKSPQKGALAPSLISTQGTTYTAPVASKPAVDEGGLPQDLFEDTEKNESHHHPEDSESAVEQEEGSGKNKQNEDKEKPSEEEEEKISDVDEDDFLPWFDVGIVKDSHITVTHYFNERQPRLEDQLNDLIEQNAYKCINDSCFSADDKVPLIHGQTYRFRVCAINGLGRGMWSETSLFKTCQPGLPSAPSSIRITKSTDGAQLTWEPPSNANTAGTITEYSVYLAVKNQSATSADSQLAFMRVYSGAPAECQVGQHFLSSAFVDQSNKPAIIFRIAARNEKGYGPATQVRWLQDQQKAAPVRNAFPAVNNTGFHYQNQGPQIKRTRYEP